MAQGCINTVGEFFRKTTQARWQPQRSTAKLYIIWVDFRRITICGQTTKIWLPNGQILFLMKKQN